MNRIEAYQWFWQSFDLNAYEETTVPDDAQMPYITYQVQMSEFETTMYNTASLWYKGTSWSAVTQKSMEIYDAIGYGGVVLHCDEGAFWIKRGTPFAQRMSDPDTLVRRIYLNVEVENFVE